jgi:hypothetical protein
MMHIHMAVVHPWIIVIMMMARKRPDKLLVVQGVFDIHGAVGHQWSKVVRVVSHWAMVASWKKRREAMAVVTRRIKMATRTQTQTVMDTVRMVVMIVVRL